MGTNSYLFRKMNYNPDIPTTIGCGYEGDYCVQKLVNGYTFNNKYYPTIEELNKEYYQKIHIGKSSCGWHYLLAIYPEYGINTFYDWCPLFDDVNNYIENEYGERVTPANMVDTITHRENKQWMSYDSIKEYEEECVRNENSIGSMLHHKTYHSYDEILADNHAVRGLCGLWAHKPDRYITNTEGPYDYIRSGNDSENCVIFS